MRTYIFTEEERRILREWLEKGLRLNGFQVLMHRIRKNAQRIREDYRLLEEVLKRSQET